MKKLILLVLSVFLFTTTFFWTSCLKTEDEGWTDEDKESYHQVLNVQDQVASDLDDWLQTMDSLDAIDMAHQAFASEASVSSAVISSQGITVQYANGMRGGLFLNPRDGGETEKSFESLIDGLQSLDSESLKSFVNKRKMILLNPHYYERTYYTDILVNSAVINLERAGITVFRNRNEGSSVEAFTQLADYGIIQIYSHGYAWPKQENITDVYLLTGETTNEATSNKYWDELKSGNIPIMKIGSSNKYFISERFISEHNDFSQDTILFYGGFCYSFLGDWPDITESFADGAYFGFDWSVRTNYNAAWAQNLIKLMSDTSMLEPMGPEAWMNNSDMVKSYWEPRDERTVHIYYTGDGNLNLWADNSVTLIALSDDGAPVNNPGEAGVAYPFRCEVVSNITELEYSWDIGDGSSPVTASNAVNITWSEDGEYVLKVDVKDKSNGNIIGSATANVTIGDSGEEELIDILKKCNHVYLGFGPEMAFLWEEEKSGVTRRDPGDLEWEEAPIVWSGLSFSATIVTEENHTHTIRGTLSSNGYTVNAVGEQQGYEGGHSFTYKLGFDNYPVKLPSEFGTVVYSVESNLIQNHVSTFEGKWVWDEGKVINFTGVDWDEIERLYLVFRNLPGAANQ